MGNLMVTFFTGIAMVLPYSANADLWCAAYNTGTPSELQSQHRLPYKVMQIDQMDSSGTIQIDITVNYDNGDRSEVLKMRADSPENDKVAGLLAGTYTETLSPKAPLNAIRRKAKLVLDNNRINFYFYEYKSSDSIPWNCEDPAQ